MNAKKKLAETKAKLKKYAPQIAIVGTVAGVFAAGYFSSKNSPVINENIEENDNEVLPGDYEVIVAITRDDLTKLSQIDNYELSHIDDDFFRLKETKIES